MEGKSFHIMMFPWLAFGHMIPYFEFELSKRLAAKGIMVSYISTPRNLRRLPPIPPPLAAKMQLLQVQWQPLDGLPEDCEATVDVRNDQTPLLKKAHDTLAEPFERLLRELEPDLIVVDFAAYWIPEVAAKYGVSTAYFSVYTASMLAYLGPPDRLMSGKKVEAPQEDYRMRNAHVPDVSGVSSAQRFGTIVDRCSFVLVRSCEEFESDYLNRIRELYQKPVLSIGLLPPIPEDQNTSGASLNSSCQWLDGQTSKSVLFVGFGSEYKMPLEEIHELAFSLELSGLPFLWILRNPQGVDDSELLPPGFVSRTQSKGLVVLGWAPQQEILAHPAIGGCLFHSGWGTTVEALSHGLPLVLLPMVADQGLTAKLLVEKQVGYEVPRNEEGSFSRDAVVASVRRVLVEEEGEQLRLKAAEMQSVFGNHESQDKYINSFIEHLENMMIKKQV